MSRKISVEFEIKSIEIMRDTLKQMGVNYNEIDSDEIHIKKRWNDIIINGKNSEISYDESDVKEVNRIKQNYMVNFYEDMAIREGAQITKEINTKGEVIINIIG